MATGILGVLSAVLMLAWPVHGPAGLVRYPFTGAEFRVIQSWFFVHHLGLVIVLVGLARSAAMGERRVARAGAWIAVVGMTLLAVNEIRAMGYGDWTLKAANEGSLGAGYGISTNLVGLGMLLAGIGVVRARRWTGPWRWVPLLVSLGHFFLVTPALFSGGYVVARLAIGSWMALFAALGWGLVVEAQSGQGARS